MRFFVDNNLSERLARALNVLSEDLDVGVTHLSHKFKRKTDDIDWIEVLADEGDWTIVSQDRFTKSNGFEKEALRRHGFTVVSLKKGWSSQKAWEKASRLIRLWPEIVGLATGARAGTLIRVPYKGKITSEVL